MHRKNSFEFFGLPGAGKTAVLRNLVAIHPDRYAVSPVFSRTKRFCLSTLFFLRHPLIGMKFISLIMKNPKELWGYLGHLLSISYAHHMCACMHTSQKIMLIDEGLTQRLLSVVPNILSEDEARKLVDLLQGVPTKIIFVQGGGFERFTRESDRMGSYRNRLGEVYLNDWMSRVTHNTEVIAQILGQENHLITIDNHEKHNLETVTRELHQKISAQG